MSTRAMPAGLLAAALLAAPTAAAPMQYAQTKVVQCTVKEGVEFHRMKNYGKALQCWEENARRGSAAAQYNIARMYALGEGVPKNTVEAYKWMSIAAKSGRPEAASAMEKIKSTMTPVQLEEAEKRVQAFYAAGRK